ncbi:MAG: hypothetical protein EXR81_04895 [Gammaproteobacteria bacterium]|nr:hypothetical protein [Gammaproteobacteria bacterium]
MRLNTSHLQHGKEFSGHEQIARSFEGITTERIKFIEDRLNNRPRKTLGYRTPNEVYKEAIMRSG